MELNVSDLKEKPKVKKKKSCISDPVISKKETVSKPVYEQEGYIYHFIRMNKEETFYNVDSIDVKTIKNASDLLNMMLQQENILLQLFIIMILMTKDHGF